MGSTRLARSPLDLTAAAADGRGLLLQLLQQRQWVLRLLKIGRKVGRGAARIPRDARIFHDRLVEIDDHVSRFCRFAAIRQSQKDEIIGIVAAGKEISAGASSQEIVAGSTEQRVVSAFASQNGMSISLNIVAAMVRWARASLSFPIARNSRPRSR